MSKTGFIDEVETELEFGDGHRHVDIRFGILNYGVLDKGERQGPRCIRIGVVGTAALIDVFMAWLETCDKGVEAKKSDKANLFPRFPGFGQDSPFNATWDCGERSKRVILPGAIAELSRHTTPGGIVKGAADLYVAEIQYLAEETKPNVIFCLVPDEISDHLGRAAEIAPPKRPSWDDNEEQTETYRHDFRHCLKAAVMGYHIPIQLVLPSTFDAGSRGKATKKRRPSRAAAPRRLQDPATLAWNFFTAMYYKAGGVPWRLVRESSDYATCYVGLSFYKSLDQQTVMTSIAQIFNERGEGIIVRGGQAEISKRDRTPHLNEADSLAILSEALGRYRQEHQTMPARLVLHKSSYFTPEELAGLKAALQQERVSMSDFLSLRQSSVRLFRNGNYPVLRGTHMALGGNSHLLYTRGSVPFYATYPGLYMPRAVEVQFDVVERSRETLCREILALTKMNWNSTQFDMRDPITLRAARSVGDILKYVPEGTPPERVARRYSFYM